MTLQTVSKRECLRATLLNDIGLINGKWNRYFSLWYDKTYVARSLSL